MSLITRGRGDDYLKEQEENQKKFESIDLYNEIKSIYRKAIKKASEDCIIEIENNRKLFLEVSYTEKQAQERFNNYTDSIRIKNENDDCFYRIIKNEIVRKHVGASKQELEELIIKELCGAIRLMELSIKEKLLYLEDLPQEIYISEKNQKQFIFFKSFAEKYMDPSKVELDANRTDIAYYVYYMKETKSLKLENPFPSEKAWKEIGELFQKNWKNVQKVYNSISGNREERLKASKIKNIEHVIKELLPNHDKALKLAKDELNMAKLNS